jgi:hypothetical protein
MISSIHPSLGRALSYCEAIPKRVGKTEWLFLHEHAEEPIDSGSGARKDLVLPELQHRTTDPKPARKLSLSKPFLEQGMDLLPGLMCRNKRSITYCLPRHLKDLVLSTLPDLCAPSGPDRSDDRSGDIARSRDRAAPHTLFR